MATTYEFQVDGWLSERAREAFCDMSIEELPVGTNLISFSRVETGKGVEYIIESGDSGWTFVLDETRPSGGRYYLNGKPVVPEASGIRMTGTRNHVLVVQ